MRVLITGGAGFIGSHLSDRLLEQGHFVHVLDDLSTGSIENIRQAKQNPRFGYTIDSVDNVPLLAEWTRRMSSTTSPRRSGLIVESPVRTIETNVHCTEMVLAQAHKKKKPVLIADLIRIPPSPMPAGGDRPFRPKPLRAGARRTPPE